MFRSTKIIERFSKVTSTASVSIKESILFDFRFKVVHIGKDFELKLTTSKLQKAFVKLREVRLEKI